MAINTAYTVNSATQAIDAPQRAAGRVTFPSDGITAADYVVFNVGFTPRYIMWLSITARISVEWFEGMAADTCIKIIAAGVRSIETTNKGITVCDADGTANTSGKYFKVSQNATLIALVASDVCTWRAIG